ncbi:MAG: hypothetical protein WBA12_12210 [Catalinimonas sp.]
MPGAAGWVAALGWVGALLFLVSYFLLITGRWASTDVRYHVCNLLGGALLTVNTLYDGSLPAAFINGAWALIAVWGLVRDYRA